MTKTVLKPACVFEQFARINEIPRPSKREEKMIDYLRKWGESHNLDTQVADRQVLSFQIDKLMY